MNQVGRFMSKRSSLRIPREHGAWAMLYVSFAVGVLVAERLTLRLLFLALAVTCVFIAHESLLAWWRSRSRGQENIEARKFAAGYLVLAGVFGAPLLLAYHLYLLAPIALGAVVLLAVKASVAAKKQDRTVSSEMVAIAGLAFTAPAAHYVARGTFDATALWLWVLCTLYFASSVFYVQLRVRTLNSRRPEARRQSWWSCALYHVFLIAALSVLTFTGSLNLFALAAFSPVLARSFWYLANPAHQINLRRVGWLEVVYSIVFLIFVTLTFRF